MCYLKKPCNPPKYITNLQQVSFKIDSCCLGYASILWLCGSSLGASANHTAVAPFGLCCSACRSFVCGWVAARVIIDVMINSELKFGIRSGKEPAIREWCGAHCDIK